MSIIPYPQSQDTPSAPARSSGDCRCRIASLAFPWHERECGGILCCVVVDKTLKGEVKNIVPCYDEQTFRKRRDLSWRKEFRAPQAYKLKNQRFSIIEIYPETYFSHSSYQEREWTEI